MRTVTIEDNKIVVEVDGAKVRYSLEIVRKRIDSLLQDLEEWRKYERLLTQRVPDAGDSAHIPSSFLRLIIFLAGRLRRPRPSAGNANR